MKTRDVYACQSEIRTRFPFYLNNGNSLLVLLSEGHIAYSEDCYETDEEDCYSILGHTGCAHVGEVLDLHGGRYGNIHLGEGRAIVDSSGYLLIIHVLGLSYPVLKHLVVDYTVLDKIANRIGKISRDYMRHRGIVHRTASVIVHIGIGNHKSGLGYGDCYIDIEDTCGNLLKSFSDLGRVFGVYSETRYFNHIYSYILMYYQMTVMDTGHVPQN